MPEERNNTRSGRGDGRGTHRHHHHHHSRTGHRRHHSHSRLKHWIKRWLRRRKWFLLGAAIIMAAILVGGFLLMRDTARQKGYRVQAAHAVDVAGGYRTVTYEGKNYRYNNRITTILYAGIDSDGKLAATSKYTLAPRADSISLVVLDEMHKKVTIIALSRDTMTDIRKYTLNGKNRGMMTDHLGYAFTYGDGGKVSCKSLCEAVSNLLYGIPINGYVVSNRASLEMLGGIVGPVEVVVPNDDLSALGFRAGEKVTIDQTNLEAFVRSRDTAQDLSNVGRMERQQAYIEGAINRIISLLTNDPYTAWEKMERAEDSVMTNITRSRYLDLTKVLKNTAYSPGQYYTPEGRQVVASDHDEFYPDQDLLRQKVIELFYLE